MNRYLCLVAALAFITACGTEPGGKEVGWRSEKVVNNPEGLLETTGKTNGHYRAWVGHTLMDIESAWGESDDYADGEGGGTVHYKKGREYENMHGELWSEYCEVTLHLGAGEVIKSVDYNGRECRHPLMQFKYQGP